MTRRRARSLLFVLFWSASSSQFAAVPAQTPGLQSTAKVPPAARTAETLLREQAAAPKPGALAYSYYNIQVVVRAMDMATDFYDSVDTSKNLPPSLRSLGPMLKAADKLRRDGDEDKAIEAYRRCGGRDIDMPRLARSYFGQALILVKIPEQRKKATPLLLQAVRYIPDNSDASLALALNYCFELDWENALLAARRAVLLQPNDATAHYWLGWIYFHGVLDNKRAIAQFEDVLRLRPNDEHAVQELGIGYLYVRKFANAVTYLKRAIGMNPNNAEAYWFLGITYLKMEDRPQAVQVYRTLRGIDKDLAEEFAARM